MEVTDEFHIRRRNSPGRLAVFNGALLVIALLVTPTAFSQRTTAKKTDLAAAMDRTMAAVYKADRPGAAVIVVKNGRVIYRKGYGLANLELKVPITPESVFRLCSVTKQFTAAAVMMLVEQGKLALDDDITKFFPDYPTGGKKIRVENLLTHTSGIPDFLNKIWPDRFYGGFTTDGLIDLFKHDPLMFEPGAKDSYSNSNYVLLGAIIEKLSGQSYGQFIEEQIFKPLGMKQSRYERNQALVPNRVSGYVIKDGAYVNAAYLIMSQLFAAAALDSTVDDLALWDAAINADKLLKHSSWERIFTRYKFSNGQPSDYGYGWVISEFQGHAVESHAGGIPGFRAYVMRLPADHVYIAMLSNDETAETQPEIVVHRLAGIAIGKPIVEPTVVKVDPKILESYVGEYQGPDDSLTIRRDGDRLFALSPDNPEVEIFPVSEVAFIIKAFDGRIAFVKDAHGKVTGLIQSAGGQEETLKKVK